MSEQDREKWNARYAEGAYESRDRPGELLVRWLAHIPRGRALDTACGIGRNARFLAARGFQVDAVDISSVGLERAMRLSVSQGVSVNWIERDLEEEPPPAGPYQLIVLMRYVNWPLLGRIPGLLAPSGVLVCEQHLVTDHEVTGPQNPTFRVRPGELVTVLSELEVLDFTEGLFEDPDQRTVALSRLVARNA